MKPTEEEAGMSTAGKVILWLFILLCLLPALLILAVFLTARFYPKSKLGQKIALRKAMFEEMMEKRKERKMELAEKKAMEKLQKKNAQLNIVHQAVNNTEGAFSSDVDDAISKSAMKTQLANKVYPATDCEDKNISHHRIGPLSEDENLVSEKNYGKGNKAMMIKDNDSVFEAKIGNYNTAGGYNTSDPSIPPPPMNNPQVAYV